MKTTLLLRLALGIGGIGLLSACTTPEARIRRNADFFATLAPAQQQLIREGRIAIGFTPDLVRLALGDPDRVVSRRDADGSARRGATPTTRRLMGSPFTAGGITATAICATRSTAILTT